jgi:hypothetical protein
MTKPNLTVQELPVKVTFNPFALESAMRAAAKEQTALEGCTIDDDDDARAASGELRLRVTELAAVERMWAETKAPIKELEKRIDTLFKPGVEAARLVVNTLRGLLEGYEKLKREAQRKALAEAAKVATHADATKLHTALVAAADAAPTQLEGTSFVRTWIVKRYTIGCVAPDGQHRTAATMIPDVFWSIDEKALARVGREHKGDEPPVVPGVVWAEELSSRVRKFGA